MILFPFAVSVMVTLPLLPKKLPPGFTVQVLAVLASEGAAARPMATTAAARLVPNRMPDERFRIGTRASPR